MDRLKVLHIASWYPSRLSPQNGNFIQRHITAIGQHTDSYLLHVVSDPQITTTEIQYKKEDGFSSCLVIYPKAQGVFRFSRSKAAHRVGLERIMDREKHFDLVHVHVLYPSVIFADDIAKKWNVPIVVTEHATAFHNYHSRPYRWWQLIWMRMKSNRVQRYLPVSDDLGIAMQSLGFDGPYTTIPNVVDGKLFSMKKERSDAQFRFIHISSLSDLHKNVSGLLSAFQVVTETYPQARLTLIGNAHHDQHQRYIHKLKLINEVTLLEEQSLEEVAAYMKASDCLVLFSNYENAPCVISEALSVGLPVIATKVGGVSAMIDAGNGILVDPNDMLGLYQAMTDMIDKRNDFDPETISASALETYDYEVVGRQYLDVYNSVLRELEK